MNTGLTVGCTVGMLVEQLQVGKLTHQHLTLLLRRARLTLLISRDCHLRVIASSCCSLLSIARATVSSTKLPMTEREMASRCSFLDMRRDMKPWRCRLSRNTMRKLRLSEK